jgi:hypothetical protein
MARTTLPLVCLLATALFTGCNHNFERAVPIGKALENPRAYDGHSITLAGTVTGRQSLFAVKYFSLKDNTGEIRVVTNRTLPNVGSHTEVHGRVQQAFAP